MCELLTEKQNAESANLQGSTEEPKGSTAWIIEVYRQTVSSLPAQGSTEQLTILPMTHCLQPVQ